MGRPQGSSLEPHVASTVQTHKAGRFENLDRHRDGLPVVAWKGLPEFAVCPSTAASHCQRSDFRDGARIVGIVHQNDELVRVTQPFARRDRGGENLSFVISYDDHGDGSLGRPSPPDPRPAQRREGIEIVESSEKAKKAEHHELEGKE